MDGIMDEKKLEDLLAMELEERWQELLADADEAIQHEEKRIEKDMSQEKDEEDGASEK